MKSMEIVRNMNLLFEVVRRPSGGSTVFVSLGLKRLRELTR
jgi:lipoate-protein ligase A